MAHNMLNNPLAELHSRGECFSKRSYCLFIEIAAKTKEITLKNGAHGSARRVLSLYLIKFEKKVLCALCIKVLYCN